MCQFSAHPYLSIMTLLKSHLSLINIKNAVLTTRALRGIIQVLDIASVQIYDT